MTHKSLLVVFIFAMVTLGFACTKESEPSAPSVSSTGEKVQQEGETAVAPVGVPSQDRVVLEPPVVPGEASWKDVGRRFQDLEKEREETLKAMQAKARAESSPAAK